MERIEFLIYALVNDIDSYARAISEASIVLRDTHKVVQHDDGVLQSKQALEQLCTDSPNLKATAVAIRNSYLADEPLEQVSTQCTNLANKLQVIAAVFETIFEAWPDSDMHLRFIYAICVKCIEVCDDVLSCLSMLRANASTPVS